jgi:hypothetical protein
MLNVSQIFATEKRFINRRQIFCWRSSHRKGNLGLELELGKEIRIRIRV